VDDAIENGVGVGGITDQLVPFVDGDLADDDGRSAAVAFFEDFEVVTGCGIERRKTPIIENEQLHTTERSQKMGITAIAAGAREIGEQLGNALIENRAIVATGFVAES
jgi:hypothetical protein